VKYPVIFAISAFFIWKTLSEFVPEAGFGEMNLPVMVALASVVCAAGLTFLIYQVEKALAHDRVEPEKYSAPGRKKESEPKFEDIYRPKS
jgi:hypothetical protein